MVFPQCDLAEVAAQADVAPEIADAARRYQRLREAEQHHLEIMARYNLLAEWTADIQAVVLEARAWILETRAARDHFRAQIRGFVTALRRARQPLPAVLRRTRSFVRMLEQAGAIAEDGGWLEAEVLEWAIEDYEPAT